MWYRRENSVIAGGPYNCDQPFPVEYLDESNSEVVAFHNRVSTPVDSSDLDNIEKGLKALALCVAQVGGITKAQLKTMFKQKWDSLS